MNKRALICGPVFAGLLVSALSASAEGIAFDCDVPPDHFSSISQDVSGPMAIHGSVQVVEMRSGRNLPVAGARMVSSDGDDSVGFQFVATSPQASKFDVVLNTKRGGNLQRNTVAQVEAKTSIPFQLALAASGKATLTVGAKRFDADFVPLTRGKAMAFCSTAQFKFSELVFQLGDNPTRQAR